MKPILRRRAPGALLIVLMLASTTAGAAFNSLFVLGDSLSDTGNAFAASFGITEVAPYSNLVPALPYSSGRLSNGPVWVEALATGLGLPVNPSLLGGTGFAFGGARSGSLPGVADSSVSLLTQASTAVSLLGTLPSNALYVVWGGSNDVREAATLAAPGTPQALADAQAVIAAGVQNMATVISTLAQAGAQTLFLPNVPDVGLTPAALAEGQLAAAGVSQLASAFNANLANLLPGLASSFGINIIGFDTFGLVNAVVANPAAFGFSNVVDPCHFANGGLGCANPDEYLFWDGIHPTAAGHALIGAQASAELATALIPVPAAAPLFLAGLLALRRLAGHRARG